MLEFVSVVLLNLLLIGVAVAVYKFWRSRRSVTAVVLRERVMQGSVEPPVAYALGEAVFLLHALGENTEEPLFAAILTALAREGKITYRNCEKKRLVSFGEEVQATLFCDQADPKKFEAPTALNGMLVMLRAAQTEESLQESEAYNFARGNADMLLSRLQQFDIEGRHTLRAAGVFKMETKKRFFHLFSGQEQLVFTERGIRTAKSLLSMRKMLRGAPEEDRPLAVLLGSVEPEPIVARLAASLAQGCKAGRQAK